MRNSPDAAESLNSEVSMSGLPLSDSLVRLIRTGSSTPRTWISQHLGEVGAILLLCAGVLAPQWEVSPTEPRIRRELFILLGLFAGFGWMLLVGKARQLRAHSFYLVAGVFSISILLSLAYGVEVLHHELSIRDFTEVPKAWLPILFFSVGYEAQFSEWGLRRLLNILGVVTILICLVGWAQFFDLKLAAALLPYYGDGGHNDYALKMYHRVYATLTNPNVLSQFLSWTMIAYALALVFGLGNRLRNLMVPIFCLITIVFSGSRYGILSAVLGFLFVLGLAVKTRRGVLKVVGLVALFAVLSSTFVIARSGSFIAAKRFDELRNPTQIDSLRGRLDFLWVEAVDYFLSSPVVGHGPAKIIFREVYTDSEYLDILKWYGVLGFSIYIFYYLWPLLKIRKGLSSATRLPSTVELKLPANLLVMRFGFVMLWMSLFMNIGMFTCFNWYLMCYLWVWVGISVRAAEVVTEAGSLAMVPLATVNRPALAWPAQGTIRSGFAAGNL